MKLKYATDICGQEILTDENCRHQVMMEWEKPYMERSIELFQPFGKVLEIGFGMGYSATSICDCSDITEYNVIECSPEVWKKFEIWRIEQAEKRPELKINLIKGRWEDVLDYEGIFDSIYFDDYNGERVPPRERMDNFTLKILKNHTKIGSRFCMYSTLSVNPYPKIKCLTCVVHNYNIDIPNYCNYARGEEMYIPVLTKISDEIEDLVNEIKGYNVEKTNEEYVKQLEKYNKYVLNNNKPKGQLVIVDNFYNNAMETRDYILTQEFKVRGNYPGQRTRSYATTELKNSIEKYIEPVAGKITDWPMYKEGEDDVYNGAFQYTTSRDRSWIHNDGFNNWAAVCYLTPNAPVTSGTAFYKFFDGTRNSEESEARGNKEIIDKASQDMTKWQLVDKIGNVFNRLIIFNSKNYHMSQDYFGTDKNDGRLFQVFFFSTEY
jgi:hypothetical protein